MAMDIPFLTVCYSLAADKPQDAQQLARKIVVEQSVESPEALISQEIEARYVGRLKRLEPVTNKPGRYMVEIEYNVESVTCHLNQLINLVFGNVSLYPGVRLEDIQCSPACANQWIGPRYGIAGIRSVLGVYGRPLLSTAIKPRGLTSDQFADLAYDFALGGGDIIKDDQNLVSDFTEFQERTAKCSAAVARANLETGNNCLYFPYISAPFEQLDYFMDWIRQIGIRGILISPLITGLDVTRSIGQNHDLIMMAHPAFTGGFHNVHQGGMNASVLYGTLYRLAGIDISIFVHPETRFHTQPNDALAIAEKARSPLGNLRPMFPCPAGGLQLGQIETACQWYGHDSVFLVGGSLLTHSDDFQTSTRTFLNKIAEQFPDWQKTESVQPMQSACEFEAGELRDRVRTLLACDNYRWKGRSVDEYKLTKDLPFEGVKRIELIGRSGELTSFDLRYFEVEPGGFTSLERHAHTHVIINVRGKGILLTQGREYPLGHLDIAYIEPNAVHQLMNRSSEPFGFFCLVDRKRDKPVYAEQ